MWIGIQKTPSEYLSSNSLTDSLHNQMYVKTQNGAFDRLLVGDTGGPRSEEHTSELQSQ